MRRVGIKTRKTAGNRAYTAAREVIFARSGQRCEFPGCGRRISLEGMNAHHRRLRSAGGSDCPCNLMALCPFCHHGKVHHHPLDARDHGWMISRFEKRPSSQVGMLLAEGMGFFNCDGQTVLDPTPSACSLNLHTTVERGELQ